MSHTAQSSRSAHASLRGYLYQVYHSALCWANLKEGEYLCFEGDEDIDRFLLDHTENWQVKDYTRSLTFRDEAVQKSILGFLHLFIASHGSARKFVFLTTAQRGKQQTNEDLPVDVLETWQGDEKNDAVFGAVSELARRGVGKKHSFRLDDEQLRYMHEGKRWQNFVAAVTWRFEQPVGEEVRDELQGHLAKLRPQHRKLADLLADHLVAQVLERSTKKDHHERTVGSADFKQVLDEPIKQIESWCASPEARRLRDVSALDRLLRRGVEPLPEEPSPAQLLQACYAVVPFYEPGRRTELQKLLGWCDDETPVAVRLITGPGGTGKTRLLIEHGLRLEERGWISGFIDADEGDEGIQTLNRTSIPTLIVVDYAETRPDLTTRLLRACHKAAQQGCAKLRVVFLARARFDWWDSLGEGQQEYGIKELAAAARITPLQALAHNSSTRLEVFTEAAGAFRAVRGADVLGEHVLSQAAPSLEGGDFEQALYLHMAALALADELWSPGQALHAGKLLDVITDHELKFVREPISDFRGDVRDRKDLTAFLGRVAAATVLVGGVSRTRMEQLVRAFSSGESQSPRKIANRFRYVYPGGKTWVIPVQPDVLGEHFVARFLDVQHTLSVIDNSEEPEFETTLTVLTRLAKRTGDLELLSGVLNERTALLAAMACRLAPQVGDPLGMVLAASLERARDFSLAGKLEEDLLGDDLSGTVSLREVRASVYGVLVEGLEEKPRDDETSNSSERARLLNNLSNQLSDLGRREEALEACSEAMGIRRKLAEARPDAFLPDLAGSLNNLSNRLSNLGRREEALSACNEAVGHYRKLAEARPDAFLPKLAGSLSNLSIRLSGVGRCEEALNACNEAVGHHRKLAEARPDVFQPDLAASLNNLSNRLSNLGRREEALKACSEAVGRYRKLAEARPDAFLPDLAMSLDNLGNRLSNLGRREEALNARTEAVVIQRKLAEARPDAFLPDLAMSLNNLSLDLGDLGRREEALNACNEAVGIRRKLAEARPDAFLPDLAMSLNNLSCCLSDLGRPEEALKACNEAVGYRRKLAEARPDAFLPDLASSVANLSVYLSELGRHKDALEACNEAVGIQRKLAEAMPDAFLPDLATSLNNLGNHLSGLRRSEDALNACNEALGHYRKLAEAMPDAFLPDLARSLNNLSNRLSDLGRGEEALKACNEAVSLLLPLAERLPSAFGELMRTMADNWLRRHRACGLRPDKDTLQRLSPFLAPEDDPEV